MSGTMLAQGRRAGAGFTMIEVMITVAIVAILAALAYPFYSGQIEKARRADAIASLQQLALEQEKFRANCVQYASAILHPDDADEATKDNPCNPGAGTYVLIRPAGTVSADGHYTLAVSDVSDMGYTLTATPAGDQAGDACGTFAMNQGGADTGDPYADGGCWRR